MLLFDPWIFFITNASCESMAYPCLRSEKCPATGVNSSLSVLIVDLWGKHCQVKSLVGAAHVLNDKGGFRR